MAGILSGLTNFWDTIVDFFELAFELVGNFVIGVLGLLDLAQVAVALPVIMQGYLPSIIGSSIVAVISCGVIKFIFGR